MTEAGMRGARRGRFTSQITVSPAAVPTLAWFPLPREDADQRVDACTWTPALSGTLAVDAESSNRCVQFTIPPSDQPTTIELHCDVERRLRRRAPPAPATFATPPEQAGLARYLAIYEPESVAQRARTLGSPGEPPITLARRVFDHLLETMTYDKAGCTPDRVDQLGDLAQACDLNFGTCTEFHGLFIGCLRALGVPARITFGFNLPRTAPAGPIAGYHCWAEVALPDATWFAVDVSEAWKRRELADFYFGSLDADRVAFSFDHNVNVAPPQRGEPLHRFIFPYCERAGEEVTPELAFRFADRE